MSSVYFSRTSGTLGYELWVTDGTTDGTRLVKQINTVPGSNSGLGSTPNHLTSVNGKLFFLADDGTHGAELWTSNGTEAGTVLVKDSVAGSASPTNARLLTSAGNTLFFIANDGAHGDELWASNGTAAGTGMLKDINPSSGAFASGDSNDLVDVNGTLFFAANDGTHGTELWKSNGSAAGTVLVKDIFPGSSESSLSEFAEFQGALFFSASDGTQPSFELWKSSGTAGTTIRVQDGGTGPTAFTGTGKIVDADGTLFFA
jgi:ELWxxDGT repeat protein